ncbi:MAG: hypothetical protein KAH32_01140, partial [Chlamydiia bacterium]|nr:hypothetical protein [Chlamydiia bacterium]
MNKLNSHFEHPFLADRGNIDRLTVDRSANNAAISAPIALKKEALERNAQTLKERSFFSKAVRTLKSPFSSDVNRPTVPKDRIERHLSDALEEIDEHTDFIPEKYIAKLASDEDGVGQLSAKHNIIKKKLANIKRESEILLKERDRVQTMYLSKMHERRLCIEREGNLPHTKKVIEALERDVDILKDKLILSNKILSVYTDSLHAIESPKIIFDNTLFTIDKKVSPEKGKEKLISQFVIARMLSDKGITITKSLKNKITEISSKSPNDQKAGILKLIADLSSGNAASSHRPLGASDEKKAKSLRDALLGKDVPLDPYTTDGVKEFSDKFLSLDTMSKILDSITPAAKSKKKELNPPHSRVSSTGFRKIDSESKRISKLQKGQIRRINKNLEFVANALNVHGNTSASLGTANAIIEELERELALHGELSDFSVWKYNNAIVQLLNGQGIFDKKSSLMVGVLLSDSVACTKIIAAHTKLKDTLEPVEEGEQKESPLLFKGEMAQQIVAVGKDCLSQVDSVIAKNSDVDGLTDVMVDSIDFDRVKEFVSNKFFDESDKFSAAVDKLRSSITLDANNKQILKLKDVKELRMLVEGSLNYTVSVAGSSNWDKEAGTMTHGTIVGSTGASFNHFSNNYSENLNAYHQHAVFFLLFDRDFLASDQYGKMDMIKDGIGKLNPNLTLKDLDIYSGAVYGTLYDQERFGTKLSYERLRESAWDYNSVKKLNGALKDCIVMEYLGSDDPIVKDEITEEVVKQVSLTFQEFRHKEDPNRLLNICLGSAVNVFRKHKNQLSNL